MADFTLTAQNVNGDPFTDGSNINIVANSTTQLIFQDVDNQLGGPTGGETVSIDGGVTFLTYTFLGYGDVRADSSQDAAFVRVNLADGSTQTFAVDMNADGDGLPNLSNGNTKLATTDLDTDRVSNFPVPPCFVSGSLIRTDKGYRKVEDLVAGDLVWTRDHGFQPIVWHGRRSVWGGGDFAPIRFAPGALGNDTALLVSPQHRMLVTGWIPEFYFGEKEVLVAAKDLVDGDLITSEPVQTVTYHHILFAQHEVIQANGTWSESFYPGDYILGAMPGVSAELFALFPELKGDGADHGLCMARPNLSGREAIVLQSEAVFAA